MSEPTRSPDAASTPFRDALDKIDGAFALHYSTGDYGPLGMALQDNETEVMRALRLAVAMEEMLPFEPRPLRTGRIVHGDADA